MTQLARTLGRRDLLVLGLGAIIGSGVFALTGHVAVTYTGPAVSLAFVIAGAAALIGGACYSELASMMPVAGSAYSYSYAALGRVPAWFVGWAAILEYSLGAALVSVVWSGYLRELIAHAGLSLPLTSSFNYLAAVIIILLTVLLVRGVRQSAYATAVLVLIKVGVVLLFVAFGAAFIDPQNWTPYIPPNAGEFGKFGVSGLMRGSSILFFAYIGFDAVATAAQESRDPERDVPYGIMGSIIVAGALYIAVATVFTGIISYRDLGGRASIGAALQSTGLTWLSIWVDIGAMAGLTSVLLVLMLGQSRILLAMSRDGLLPPVIGAIHPRFQTPYHATILTGLVSGLAAAFLTLPPISELVTVGTLVCFAVVCIAVVLLRRSEPDRPRPFHVRASPWLPLLGAATCIYMLCTMPMRIWLWAALWFAGGFVLYLILKRKVS